MYDVESQVVGLSLKLKSHIPKWGNEPHVVMERGGKVRGKSLNFHQYAPQTVRVVVRYTLGKIKVQFEKSVISNDSDAQFYQNAMINQGQPAISNLSHASSNI